MLRRIAVAVNLSRRFTRRIFDGYGVIGHVLQAQGAVTDMENQIAAVEGIAVDFSRRDVNHIFAAVVGYDVIASALRVLINLLIIITRYRSVILAQPYSGVSSERILSAVDFNKNIFTVRINRIVAGARVDCHRVAVVTNNIIACTS